MGCLVLPAFRFVPAQRAIRSDSLAHRARKPCLLISKGPTGRPFAVKGHHSESNCRPVGTSTSGGFRFQGRWPWLFELLALWAETKKARKPRSSSWTGSKVGRRSRCSLVPPYVGCIHVLFAKNPSRRCPTGRKNRLSSSRPFRALLLDLTCFLGRCPRLSHCAALRRYATERLSHIEPEL